MPGFKQILSGTDPLASDVQQIIDALLGKNDVGALSLLAAITAPGAPTVAVNATAGNLNGTYLYKATFCTGYKDSDATVRINGETAGGTTSVSVSPVNQQVNLSNIPVGPTGTVARRIYRTAAGGADGTQKLVTTINDNITTSWTDNLADASLGAAVPAVNTTGTTLSLVPAQLIVSHTPDQSVAAASGNQPLWTILNMLANRVKTDQGTTNWYDAPAISLSGANAKFDPTTGHTHDGTAGNGPKLPVSSLTTTPCQIASGSYIGDGTAGRTITVGFQPKFLYISGPSICTGMGAGSGFILSHGSGQGWVLMTGASSIASLNNYVTFASSGFVVGTYGANNSGSSYSWVAWA